MFKNISDAQYHIDLIQYNTRVSYYNWFARLEILKGKELGIIKKHLTGRAYNLRIDA